MGCPDDNISGVKSLCIINNSNQEMYFWYSKDYTTYHYPDTILPIIIPMNSIPYSEVRGAGSGSCVGSMEGQNPAWEIIFSQLPEGLFTVYFFETRPETQEDWDILRENMEELVYRKDISFEELKANNYIIEYP